MRSRRPLSCRSSAAIASCINMIMHDPMTQGSVHNSWRLKMSQFFNGLHTHQTCHQLSMFGRLWIGMCRRVLKLMPIFSNFHSIPQAMTSSLINSMRRRCVVLQMVVTTDTDWFSDPRPYPFFKGISDQQHSQSY